MRISRRGVLLLGIGAAWGAERQFHLSLLPLYTKDYSPVSSGYLTAASTALERTYLVVTEVLKPQLYDGAAEGNVLLDNLSLLNRRVMGIMTAPLRVRSPNFSGLRNVCGNAYTPSELHEWPTASIVTTYEFQNMAEEPARRHLGAVTIHELGHNLGAWDCEDRSCFMYGEVDISGKYLPLRFCMRHKDLLWQYLR